MTPYEANEITEMRRELAELSASVHGLVEAWNTAKGIVRFVKWLSTMAVAVTSIWALFKLGSGK